MANTKSENVTRRHDQPEPELVELEDKFLTLVRQANLDPDRLSDNQKEHFWCLAQRSLSEQKRTWILG